MLTQAEKEFFAQEQAVHEAKYLVGGNPRHQSGFGRDALDWERFRRPVAAPIDRDGSFLDVGCANGLLMESVVAWAREAGHQVAPFGVDISEKLAELARQRLPRWRDRIFVGNALLWEPPARFDFVRTELVYVPPQRRREYAERLLARFVAPGGRLILCSYGSSRPEGARADPLVDEIRGWGLPLHCVHDVVSPEHGFVITRVVSVLCLGAAGASTGCRWTPARKGAGAMRILGLRSGGMHPRILHAGRWPSACTRRAAARFAGSHA